MKRRAFLGAAFSLSVLAVAVPAQAGNNFFKRLLGSIRKSRKAAKAAAPGSGASEVHRPAPATTPSVLSPLEADHGLRKALDVGIEAVVQKLGAPGGFLNDAKVRISLPKTLRRARELVKPLGLAGPFDDLQARMNYGAEAAMPEARALLRQAVARMSVDDAIAIVRGPDDSATRYLRKRMEPSLRDAFTPVVRNSLDQTGALGAGKKLADRYALGQYADKLSDNLTRHVVGGALDGAFYYLAKQEEAIRANPGNFASSLLKRVFG